MIFLTRPGLIALSSLCGPERGNLLSIGAAFMGVQRSESEREQSHTLTRTTGCRSPTRCGSLCLQSSSLLQPGDRGQEETDVRGKCTGTTAANNNRVNCSLRRCLECTLLYQYIMMFAASVVKHNVVEYLLIKSSLPFINKSKSPPTDFTVSSFVYVTEGPSCRVTLPPTFCSNRNQISTPT